MVKIEPEDYKKLLILARRTLHTAVVWNDHNFPHPYTIAKETALTVGVENIDDANTFFDSLPPMPIEHE
jgi:hypothetical protein